MGKDGASRTPVSSRTSHSSGGRPVFRVSASALLRAAANGSASSAWTMTSSPLTMKRIAMVPAAIVDG